MIATKSRVPMRGSSRVRALTLAASLVCATAITACQASTGQSRGLAGMSIPRDASRFSIVSFTDTTVSFRAAEVRWLKAGMSGHVVDPSQRDALVARLMLMRIDSAGAMATIVGGVSPVSAGHIVLFEKPSVSWYRDRRFWFGTGAGAVLGVIAGSAAK